MIVASVVRRPLTCSKGFSIETMGLFQLHSICSKGENNKYIFGLGHMTKMAAMSVYV